MKKAYSEIIKTEERERLGGQQQRHFGWVWKTSAPAKAQVTAWRLLWNRLPTMDNLHKRIAIDEEERICCCCKSELETAKHLFLDCVEMSRLWYNMTKWVGAEWAAPRTIEILPGTFSSLLGEGVYRKRLGGLWVCVV